MVNAVNSNQHDEISGLSMRSPSKNSGLGGVFPDEAGHRSVTSFLMPKRGESASSLKFLKSLPYDLACR